MARGEPGRVAKAILIGAIPPVMVQSDANSDGVPIQVFDGFRSAVLASRAQFFLDLACGPFYGFNREGAKVSQGLIDNWWRQGMAGGAKAHYDCIAVPIAMAALAAPATVAAWETRPSWYVVATEEGLARTCSIVGMN